MAYSSSFMLPLLLLLLLSLSLYATIATPSDHEHFARKEKMTHLHFYFHEMYSGPNATGLVVAVPPGKNSSIDTFGALIVIDDMLREGPERSSKLIGRAQGLSAQASLDGTALLTAINFVFTEGEYNGSTVVILGKTVSSALTIEHTIVGGSGRFRMARGYTVSKVISWGGGCFLMEFDAYIIHH
ncbi:disease resistance response protein 206 [Musa troglodytarum]|uniref:Dirigent protein n=2 Tax=Musa troglodytarum TaxID=320322 RepID=A0A9E7HMB2_9LILI|nr:disease resistance response protein 206 [Musa troglodytarum]